MKITLVSTHSFPLPTITHTGDDVILHLATALTKLGNEVKLCAPEGTDFPDLLPMRASYGKYPPSSQECELEALDNHLETFVQQDIIHDFSNTKCIVQKLNEKGYTNTCCTLMGGPWLLGWQPLNLCAWSRAHRERIMRGATDYENTPTPDLAGANGYPVDKVHVVNGGVDTEFYHPSYHKKDYYLWLNRWHPVKGYKQAIEFAHSTGEKVILAGEHPDNLLFDYEKKCCFEAIELTQNATNIKFEFLPKDPDHHITKRRLYQEAIALLYPVQFQEPFGLSMAEALACGTPVIGHSYYGSCPEVVGECGLGADIETCRKRAVDKFDISVMAKNYLQVYQGIK